MVVQQFKLQLMMPASHLLHSDPAPCWSMCLGSCCQRLQAPEDEASGLHGLQQATAMWLTPPACP